MARYTTRIEADAGKYPVLLSNGNLKEEGQLEGGRHYAVWEVSLIQDWRYARLACFPGAAG
jgi:aminopeptidase N